MCNWRWIVTAFSNGLTEYYGEQYGKNFKEMIHNTPIGDINKDTRDFIYEQFIEYTCTIIRDQIENYEDNILDYVENTINDFYRQIIETDINEISESDRKYVMMDFVSTDITKNRKFFDEIFKKAKRNSMSSKIFIVHKDIEVPSRIYFWIFKTDIITSMENLYDMDPRRRNRYWGRNCPYFSF